ncbi:restriction endonuclease [Candidatus Uhrbacteria bacterium]|nr:restriction endonuclease [Candidatus Uhrbacteria bacterium]
MPIFIIKSTGEREALDLEKVKRGCERSGASRKLCSEVATQVEKRAKDGMTTAEIYKLVFQTLNGKAPPVAARFTLREALFTLGPLGYNFEHYIAKVFEAYGYKTELPAELQGVCVTHEVDVLAQKDNRVAMIECKFRNTASDRVTIKDTMATWARFLDLVDGAAAGKCPHLDECWIVTNSLFSGQSVQFGHCKNMVMLSWDHPRERPLPAWIDDKGLYPVTLLTGISDDVKRRLIEHDFVLLQDLAGASIDEIIQKTGVPGEIVKKCVADAKAILRG